MKKRIALQDKAEAAMKKAVKEVIEKHAKQTRSVKVSKEAVQELRKENDVRISMGKKEYIISKYHPKRYFVIVAHSGSVVPVFPFDTKQEALDYINKSEKRRSK